MKLGLIDCDELLPSLKEQYGDYSRMFEDKLGSLDPDLRFVRYSAIEQHYPQYIDECDAYLITGSKTGVYDDAHWLPGLAEFIQSLFKAGIPLVGICFGHQMVAHTLGGRAEKSHKGWGLGVCTYPLVKTHHWMGDHVLDEFALLYSHQDQVTALPQGAESLVESEFCEHAAFIIDNRILGIQGHPEFPPEYLQTLMQMRKERYPAEKFEGAYASLSEPTDSDIVNRWIIGFIRHGANK